MDDVCILSEITELLKDYNGAEIQLLANTVAAVCDVNIDEMLSDNGKIHNTHARYLYWYSIRYLTHDSNTVIAKTSIPNKTYAADSVRKGINYVIKLIDYHPQWAKRWRAVKRVVSTIKNETIEKKNKIIISVPEGIEVEIKKL